MTAVNLTNERKAQKSSSRASKVKLRLAQIGLALFLLACWQFLPLIPGLRNLTPFLDPFFISSPTAVASTLFDFLTASNGRPSIWPYLWDTVSAALIGTALGAVLGALAGLLLSGWSWGNRLFQPFLTAFNAIPRIAIIPIFVIILGPNVVASVTTAVTVVFFVVFFNALEGGRSVPAEVLQNARLLGANNVQLMAKVRFRYVLAWSMTSLPNAVSFGLLIVVTAEVMTGSTGMGRLLTDSMATVQPSLTYAVVILLSVLGIILVALTEMLRKRLLHWWIQED